MKITILGGGGRMGGWFARYFAAQRHELRLVDIDPTRVTSLAGEVRAAVARPDELWHASMDALWVTTPLAATPPILMQLATEVHPGLPVVEISSVKHPVWLGLEALASHGARPIALHPLYGPRLALTAPLQFALVPVRDAEAEATWVRQQFPAARVEVVSAADHDQAMAHLLTGTHFTQLFFGRLLRDANWGVVERLATPRFRRQLSVLRDTVWDDVELYAGVYELNPAAHRLLTQARRQFEEMIQRYVAGAGELQPLLSELRQRLPPPEAEQ